MDTDCSPSIHLNNIYQHSKVSRSCVRVPLCFKFTLFHLLYFTNASEQPTIVTTRLHVCAKGMNACGNQLYVATVLMYIELYNFFLLPDSALINGFLIADRERKS